MNQDSISSGSLSEAQRMRRLTALEKRTRAFRRVAWMSAGVWTLIAGSKWLATGQMTASYLVVLSVFVAISVTFSFMHERVAGKILGIGSAEDREDE